MPRRQTRSAGVLASPAVALTLFALLVSVPSVGAQDRASSKKEDEDPGFETIELLTKVSMTSPYEIRLKATYYPSPETDRSVVPIIIVHDENTTRNDYHLLALALQAKDHSVIVPDLRGYGESTRVKMPAGKPDEQFDHSVLKPEHYKMIVGPKGDLDAVKSFLREQNDAGKLNLNKLCVIGVGALGSLVATNWSAYDWAVPDLVGRKQGRDVKALILVSPEMAYKGLFMMGKAKPLEFLASRKGAEMKPTQRVSFFIVVGGGTPTSSGRVIRPKDYRTAERIQGAIARYHDEPPTERDEIPEKQTLFFGVMETTLQGGQLLNERNRLSEEVQVQPEDLFKPVPLVTMMKYFIQWRLVDPEDEEFPWSPR